MTEPNAENSREATLKPDKDVAEPVNINDSFRKAKRNSLLWSVATILVVLGDPVTREGTKTEEALVPVYPLGIGFQQWMLVAIGLVIATYMVIAFKRALHPINLMNSQRFRRLGLDTVPKAMVSLAEEIEAARERLRIANIASHQTQATYQTLARNVADIGTWAKSEINREVANIQKFFPDDPEIPEIHVANIGDPQLVPRKALEKWINCGNDASERLEELEKTMAARMIDAEPQFFDLDPLAEAVQNLAEAANELTQYHHAIDKTDQDYLEKFDIEPTIGLYSSAFVMAVAWLGFETVRNLI